MKRNTNAERLSTLFRQYDSADDWSGLLSRDQQSLCRKTILAKCKFPRSTLYQNQAVKDLLYDQELVLRGKNILISPKSFSDMDNSSASISDLTERVNVLNRKLEQFRNKINSANRVFDELMQE